MSDQKTSVLMIEQKDIAPLANMLEQYVALKKIEPIKLYFMLKIITQDMKEYFQINEDSIQRLDFKQ